MSYLVRGAYSVLITALLPFLLLKMGIRVLFDRKGDRKAGPRRRIFERFGYSPRNIPKHGVIFHVVSVGETIAAMELISKFLKFYPKVPVTVTCTTPTASRLIAERLQPRVSHCYLPFDHPNFVKRFFHRLQPKALFVLETELWPNLCRACERQNIPMVLLNARLSQKSYDGYRKFGPAVRPMFDAFRYISCQGQRDADFFLKLRLEQEKCLVTGNLKFDLTIDKTLFEKAKHIKQTHGASRPMWIAASTHNGEDSQVLDAHKALLEQTPELVLVLVPRHPQRTGTIVELVAKTGLRCTLHTEKRPLASHEHVLIVDTIGELMSFYKACDVSLVCGSLVPHGGHNPLEPAALQKPIISGPHVHNFTQVYDELIEERGAVIVKDSASLANEVKRLLDSNEAANAMGQRAHTYLLKHKGATEKSLNLLEQVLEAR